MEKIADRNLIGKAPSPYAPPINQIRDAVNLVGDDVAAFDIVLEAVLTNFDVLNDEERQEAVVLLILGKKNANGLPMSLPDRDDLSISLQDILTIFSVIKHHPSATKETILAITAYEDTCDLDLVLARGIERYNELHAKNPVSLKKDWVEVVTHDVKNAEELCDRVARHFFAINRNANNDLRIPSDCLLDTLVVASVKVKSLTQSVKRNFYCTSSSINSFTTSLSKSTLATNEMKQTLNAYRNYADFDVLLTGVAQRYKMIPDQPNVSFEGNSFKKLQNNWNIMYPYLSWKDWGRVATTGHHMNKEYQDKMRNSLIKPVQMAVERNCDTRTATLKAIHDLGVRIASEIPVNKKGIHYIQYDLRIKCGPNKLIDIKTNRCSLKQAEILFSAKDDALRKQFSFLNDAQFAPIQKYCVDGFISANAVAQFSNDHVINLANFLIKPNIQSYIDQIALDRDQPIQVDIKAFFRIMSVPYVEFQLETEKIYAFQLLKVTSTCLDFFIHRQVSELFKKDSVHVKKNLVQFSQLLELSANDLAKLLKLMTKQENPLDLLQFLQLNWAGKRLLLDTEMYSLIESGAIAPDDFFAACTTEADQQKLHLCLNELVALIKSDRSASQQYVLKDLIEVLTDKDNFKVLSKLIYSNKLPVETLINLDDDDKDHLRKSILLQEFFDITNEITIVEFFNLPPDNQVFIEQYWPVLVERVKAGEITWAQVKNSSKIALEIFHTRGIKDYIEFVSLLGDPEWVVMDS